MLKPRRQCLAVLAFAALVVAGPGPARAAEATDAPRVVASIKPVHSLVATVMQGVATPRLLIEGGQSPHSYDLRPSEAAALADADLVVWIGPALESFLVGPVDTLARAGASLALQSLPDLTRHRTRRGGVWAAHDHGHDDHGHEDHGHEDHGHEDHGHEDPGHGDIAAERLDPHLWLDPANGRVMLAAIAERLAEVDPARAETYAANAKAARARLARLAESLAARLAPVRTVPYVVFHDAYQYFEVRFDLNAVGSVTLDPGRAPGARRLMAVREALAARGARCIFREPQFAPDLVTTVSEGRDDLAVGVLDPLGAALASGADAYPTLLRNLTDSLVGCLGEAGAAGESAGGQ